MDAKEGGLTGKAGIWPYVHLSVNQEATTFSGGTSLVKLYIAQEKRHSFISV